MWSTSWSVTRLPDRRQPRARAESDGRSLEAEIRSLLVYAGQERVATIVNLVGTDQGVDIAFESDRLGLRSRTPDL